MSMKTKIKMWIREHLCRGIKICHSRVQFCHSRAGGNLGLDPRIREDDRGGSGKDKTRKRAAIFGRGFVKTKKVITIAVLLVLVATSIVVLPSLTQASWFGQGGGATRVWNYRQKIVINHKMVSPVGKSTLTNFPVEISIPANALTKSMNNGGHVGLDSGYDIVFTSGDGKTKYAHEIESYASTTGAIIAWVKIPSV